MAAAAALPLSLSSAPGDDHDAIGWLPLAQQLVSQRTIIKAKKQPIPELFRSSSSKKVWRFGSSKSASWK